MSSLSIVLVTFNSAHLIESSIAPLIRDCPKDAEIVIVDNASQDQTVDRILALGGPTIVIKNSENVGFARAINIGLRHVPKNSVALLLNPDCIISAESISEAAYILRSEPRVGVLAPVVTHPTGRLTVADAGRQPTVFRLACHYFGLSRAFEFSRRFQGLYLLRSQLKPPLQEVDWVSGACMFVSAQALHFTGGLPERWFMYAEDVEFCLRVRDIGLSVVVATELEALHDIGASSKVVGEKGTNSAWLLNLYDLYVQRYAPSSPRRTAWRFVAASGMLSRSMVYYSRFLRSRDPQWNHEARAFLTHAFRILTA